MGLIFGRVLGSKPRLWSGKAPLIGRYFYGCVFFGVFFWGIFFWGSEQKPRKGESEFCLIFNRRDFFVMERHRERRAFGILNR